MVMRLPALQWLFGVLAAPLVLGCGSNCVPIDNGGVLVDVTGISDCTRLAVTAGDASDQYVLDPWPAPESDGGTTCSFLGLAGHTGTYTVSVSLDGQPLLAQSVMLERTDECNIAGRYLKFNTVEP